MRIKDGTKVQMYGGIAKYPFSRCGLRLTSVFCRVGYHVEAPSQCDVDGRSSIQGSSPKTRYFYLTLNLFQRAFRLRSPIYLYLPCISCLVFCQFASPPVRHLSVACSFILIRQNPDQLPMGAWFVAVAAELKLPQQGLTGPFCARSRGERRCHCASRIRPLSRATASPSLSLPKPIHSRRQY